MAINAQILLEMEIPESYIDSLPKVQEQTEILYKYFHFEVVFFLRGGIE